MNAYDMRARGETTEASAAFDELVNVLVSLGETRAPGLGGAQGEVVKGRTSAGFTVITGDPKGTWFFDIETGDPFAFAPEGALRRGTPPLDGSLFVTLEAGEQLGLFDPVHRSHVELPGALFSVHPDGHRAYVLGEDCRIREVGLEKMNVTRTLAAPRASSATPQEQGRRPECEAHELRDAAITADGRWLSTRMGRWNLTTGAHRPLPFRAGSHDHEPAISPDGRYAARVAAAPGPFPTDAPRVVLQLWDLGAGAVKATSKSLSALANGDPLSFGSEPPRVCVFDYSFRAFEVPSLREYEPGDPALAPGVDPLSFGARSCETWFVRPPPAHPDLVARLASRVCSVGGFLLPVEHCANSP